MKILPSYAFYYVNRSEMLIAVAWCNQLMLWVFAHMVIQQQVQVALEHWK
jgi:hypothetical protein